MAAVVAAAQAVHEMAESDPPVALALIGLVEQEAQEAYDELTAVLAGIAGRRHTAEA